MQTEDGSLISKCLNGEPEAFGILVDKYKSGIYAFVYTKLNDFRDAQDVTQDVFVEAFCKLHSLKRWESFAFWLYRIASNLCKRWIRTKIRHPEPEFIEDQNPLEIDSTAISSYRDDQMNQLIREAMDSLPEIYREILLLYYFGGMNSNEIAKALGVSPTAILQRLTRARAQLKEDIIGMIGITFNEKKLGSGFTFHIVEAVKRLKINPVSTTKGLPWGLSLATGMIIAVISINPAFMRLDNVGTPVFTTLPSEMKVFKSGEIPVNTLKIANMPILSSMMGKGKDGELKPDMQNAFFMAPQGEGKWSQKADMDTPRSGHGVCAVNGKLYAFGGRYKANGELKFVATIDEYDPKLNKWINKSDLPDSSGLDVFGYTTLSGKIYIIGGENINGDAVATNYEYDPSSNTWAKKADMPTARFLLRVALANGKIYAMSGVNWNLPIPWTAAVEEYDPSTDKWTKKADKPNDPTAYPSVVSVNNKIYVFGGYDGQWLGPSQIVWEYDPIEDIWKQKGSKMLTPRLEMSACESNGKIYAIGGYKDGGNNVDALTTMEIYDPILDSWEKKENMFTERMSFATASLNGKIYAVGGCQKVVNSFYDSFLSSVEEYTPEGWSVPSQGKLPNTWGKLKAK